MYKYVNMLLNTFKVVTNTTRMCTKMTTIQHVMYNLNTTIKKTTTFYSPGVCVDLFSFIEKQNVVSEFFTLCLKGLNFAICVTIAANPRVPRRNPADTENMQIPLISSWASVGCATSLTLQLHLTTYKTWRILMKDTTGNLQGSNESYVSVLVTVLCLMTL